MSGGDMGIGMGMPLSNAPFAYESVDIVFISPSINTAGGGGR